jgi:NodT family efflux transporter outer membrane factor (OMF) lipoprotein
MRQFTIILLSAIVLSAAGCVPKTAPAEPQRQLPHPPAGWTALTTETSAPPSAWLNSFADPQLVKLVDEALQGNYNLQLLAARIKTAAARARIAGAELSPTAELQFGAARRQSNSNGSAAIENNFSWQGSLSWEVDLWKRLGYGKQAALNEVEASLADRQAAQFSLAANVARNWFRLSEAELQLQLASDTEASYRQSLQVIEEQYRSGINSALDLRLARSSLANAQSIRADRQRQLDLQRRELEILLGRYPSGTLQTAGRLPLLAMAVPVGLPSTLLQRRPDLQAAALRLTAGSQRFAAADLNRLPIFQLTAATGAASDRLYQLLDWDYLLWSLAGSLVQPLFDGGQRSAEQDLAAGQVEELLADYASSALNAYREVEAALAAESYLQQQERALQTSATEAIEAQALAEQRYRQGLEGIITLLETQRRAFSARLTLFATSRQRLENRINLHLALGGPFAAAQEAKSDKELR